jgi:transposase
LNCYICLDIQRQGLDRYNYFKNLPNNTSNEIMAFDSLMHGVFILVSSIDLEPNEVLPCYYNRQTIEQVFDYMKGYIDIIPLRCHTEETLSGHFYKFFGINRILTS